MLPQYHLINNKCFLESEGRVYRDQIYSQWKAQWIEIYAQQGSEHHPTADDFTRHDLFSCLTHNDQVIAFSAHTFLDLGDPTTLDRDYWQMFGQAFAKALHERDLRKVLSFESLVVNPDYRKNAWNLPLGRLLMRINSYVLDTSNAQAIMAVARNDNSVSSNLSRLNYEMIEKNKMCRNFPCDLQILKRGPHLQAIDETGIETTARVLWKRRKCYSGPTFYDFNQEVVAAELAFKMAA